MSSPLLDLSHLLQYNLKNRFRKADKMMIASDLWIALAKAAGSSAPFDGKP